MVIRTPRSSGYLAWLTIVLGASCALPLEDLAPFACAEDGTCPGGYVCSKSGQCVEPPSCSVGESCAGECIEVLDNDLHCGACGNACEAGTKCCGAECVDLAADASHCGTCDTSCDGLETCDGGTCGCQAPLQVCDGACVDTQESSSHCGACDSPCGGLEICDVGQCECAPENQCGQQCVNLSTNPEHCGGCFHDCGGAACSGGLCEPVVLASGQGRPSGIIVVGSDVYWVNRGTDAGGYLDGAVMRADAGGAGAPAVLASNMTRPVGVASDGVYLYWVNRGTEAAAYQDGSLWRLALPAGGPELLASGLREPFAITTGGQYLFLTTIGTPGGAGLDGEVHRAPLTSPGSLTVIASGQHKPQGIVADEAYAFWSNVGTFTDGTHNGDSTLERINHDGTGLFGMAVGNADEFGGGVALAGGSVLFAVFGTAAQSYGDGRVLSQQKEGGDLGEVAVSLAGPLNLTTDATHAYWTEVLGERVRRAPVGGGAAITLISGAPVIDLAVDATSVFATDAGTRAQGYADGRLLKVPK